MNPKKIWIISGCISCWIACAGDFPVLYFLGKEYPGYNQFTDTISALGASVSPVSAQISEWWVMTGLLFIIFAVGFGTAFREKGFNAKLSSCLIALYGIGEGFGSGLFKADHTADRLTLSLIIHNVIGGIGVVAILSLPLIMQRVIPKTEKPLFYTFSKLIFFAGVSAIVLFLFRYSGDNLVSYYKGLWQRISLLITYIYFFVISIMMFNKSMK
jgi:hypothetical protein